MNKILIAVLLSCSVVLADERPFEEWLDERIGTIALSVIFMVVFCGSFAKRDSGASH